jgi:hypothetical protein
MSVLSALIATSRYYSIESDASDGAADVAEPWSDRTRRWLVLRSIHRIHHFEARIRELSQKYRSIAQFIE